MSSKRVNFYVNTRPYLRRFLAAVAKWYDVVIFTASMRDYADRVIDKIDLMGVVQQRYYRESCKNFSEPDESVKHIKDMAIIRQDKNLGKVSRLKGGICQPSRTFSMMSTGQRFEGVLDLGFFFFFACPMGRYR